MSKGDGTIEIKAEMKERKIGNRNGEDSLQTCSRRSFKAHSDMQESSLFFKKNET